MKFTVLVILTLLVHVALGWLWGAASGMAAGILWSRGAWWKAALVVSCSWAILVLYSLSTAPGPTLELHRLLGGLAGGLPAWSAPFGVVAVGGLLGLAGGLVGSGIRRVAGPAVART